MTFSLSQLRAESISGEQILDYFCPKEFNNLPLSSWDTPTRDDFQLIETYLRNRQERIRENLSADYYILPNQLDGYVSYRLGRTKIIDHEEPKLIKVYFGNNPDDRECCIISYAGCQHGGRNYENGLKIIIKALEKLKFKGHLIYRLGGWPSLSKGRLRYADVPYAFKPFMFEEVKQMGYKHILWLDSCCVPINDLSPIFSCLEKNGYCYYQDGIESSERLENWSFVREHLNAPQQQKYINVITQIVGISSTHQTGQTLLNEWIDAACHKLPFLNPTGDQMCLLFLINKHQLKSGMLPATIKCENASLTFELPKNAGGSFFYHNYKFVDAKDLPSEEFFNYLPVSKR